MTRTIADTNSYTVPNRYDAKGVGYLASHMSRNSQTQLTHRASAPEATKVLGQLPSLPTVYLANRATPTSGVTTTLPMREACRGLRSRVDLGTVTKHEPIGIYFRRIREDPRAISKPTPMLSKAIAEPCLALRNRTELPPEYRSNKRNTRRYDTLGKRSPMAYGAGIHGVLGRIVRIGITAYGTEG